MARHATRAYKCLTPCQTIEFYEALLIEGYLEQAREALQLAEEAMHAVFEADSLLG